jgi:hypothetical protein
MGEARVLASLDHSTPQAWSADTRQRMAAVLTLLVRARGRLWRQAVWRDLGRWAAWLAVPVAGLLLALRMAWWPARWDGLWQGGLGVLAVAIVAVVAWRRPRWWTVAVQLDRLGHTHDRLATAWWLATQPERDGWGELQIQRAGECAATLDAAALLPWPRTPRPAWLLVAAVLVVVSIAVPCAWLQGLTEPHPLALSGLALDLPASPAGFVAAVDQLASGDLEHLLRQRKVLDDVRRQVSDAPTRAWLDQVHDVLDRVADGRLDKGAAMALLAQLQSERPLTPAVEAEPEPQPAADAVPVAERERSQDQAVRDQVAHAVQEAAKQLSPGEARRALEQAASEKDLGAMADALKKVADGMTDAELDKAVRALEQFAKALGDRKVPDQFKQLAQRIERLQRQREQQGGLSSGDQDRLRDSRRQLDQLQKAHGDVPAAEHRLERLEKQAKQAADELRRQQQAEQGGKPSADDQKALREAMQRQLRQAADELRRESGQQGARQAQRMGESALRDLREALQRGGGGREQQRQSFEQKAAGRKPASGQGEQERTGRGRGGKAATDPGQDPSEGENRPSSQQDGKGQADQRLADRQGKRGEQQQDVGRKGDAGEKGEASKTDAAGRDGRGKRFKLGQGNLGGDDAWNALREQAAGTPGGKPGAGSEAGQGPGSEDGGRAQQASGTARTERVQGVAGEGPDVKKTFADAARRGFAKQGWRQVFVDYSEVAQEMLDKERLPKGKRAWVLRYFRDIRPR